MDKRSDVGRLYLGSHNVNQPVTKKKKKGGGGGAGGGREAGQWRKNTIVNYTALETPFPFNVG